jgi:hypothetical protein
MGLLSNRGPPPWHPATPEIKNACKQAAEYCQVWINLACMKSTMHGSKVYKEGPLENSGN